MLFVKGCLFIRIRFLLIMNLATPHFTHAEVTHRADLNSIQAQKIHVAESSYLTYLRRNVYAKDILPIAIVFTIVNMRVLKISESRVISPDFFYFYRINDSQ